MKKTIILMLCLLCSIGLMAQKKSITGVVMDASGETVIGASVVEVGTTNGVITNLDGKFMLSVDPNGKIKVSYIGYQAQVIDVKGKASFLIKLKEDSEMLDEVVITGYGGNQLRSKSTNSIAKVGSEKLTVGAYTNPAQALSGAVSGLRVAQTSGDPGATPTIILRGGTNLDGSGSPLVIVDGQVRGSLSDINPEDIEDLQVMKDAGATAIYGARANDGVILVTTKKGKTGSAEINFKAKVGLNYLNNPYEFCDAADYLYWMRTAYSRSSNMWQRPDGSGTGYVSSSSLGGAVAFGTGNKYFESDGVTPLKNNSSSIYSTMYLDDTNRFLLQKGWESMKDPITGKDLIFRNTDVGSYNFNTPALTQDYNINISGGSDKGHYYAGLGYNDSEGLPLKSFYKRYTFVFNGDYKIKDWLTSTSSFNFARANWEKMPATSGSEYNYFGRILSTPPTVRYEDEEGNLMLGQHSADGNQAFQLHKFHRDNQSDKFTMNQSLKFDIIKGLSLKLTGNWYYDESLSEGFDQDYYQTPTVINSGRSTFSNWSRKFDQTYNAVLSYNKQLTPDHFVDVMLGTEYYDSYSRSLSASGQGAATDDFGDLGLTDSGENKRNINSSHAKERILSYFGRVNYDYKSKYLLSLVMRADGYSRLIDNRWGVFPGISAGWVFSKENFMKDLSNVISFAKLRTSFGLNGKVDKNQIGYYTLQGAYATTTSYDGNSSYALSNIPNPAMKWEKSRTIEVGLDVSFLDNRLSSNFTYYNRLTSDKYANINLPVSSGISSILTNNGKIRNQGLEVDLNAKIIQGKDWTWTAGANIAYNKNTIVSLPNNGQKRNRQSAFEIYTGRKLADGTYEKEWVGGYQEGYEPGLMYAYQAEGIYKNWDEIPDYMVDKGGGGSACVLYGKKSWADLKDTDKGSGETGASKVKKLPIQPGDVKWKDVNNDGMIDQYDLVKVGNTKPHFTGGFNTSVSWKGLKLYAAFDYALDYKIYDQTNLWFLGCMQGAYNMTTDVHNTWSEENPNGSLPKYYWADQLGKSNYYRTSTMFCYDASYLSIREISLSYTLPKMWVNKAKLQKVEVSVTGQNLGYITECDMVATPESLNGQAGSGYALPRTLLFGISVTL
ncbi:MAG: TonB-dependent receptor [Bacteroides sp.]